MLVPRPSVREVLLPAGGAALSPDAEARARDALARLAQQQAPWYLRLVIGVGAWAGGGFLLSFVLGMVMMAVGRQAPVAATAIGFLLTAGATVLRRGTTGLFLRQVALVGGVTGQILLIGGIGQQTESVIAASLAALAVSAAILVLFPDSILRFCAVLVATAALTAIVVDWKLRFGIDVVALLLVAAVLWLWRVAPRAAIEESAEIVEPVVHGLVVALFGVLLVAPTLALVIAGIATRPTAPPTLSLVVPMTIGFALALIGLVAALFKEHGVPWSRPDAALALAGVVLLGTLTYRAPEILAAIFIMLLGFSRRARGIVVLAVLFFLVFTVKFYYDLDLSLLQKSGVLILSGVVCLAAWVFVRARFGGEAA